MRRAGLNMVGALDDVCNYFGQLHDGVFAILVKLIKLSIFSSQTTAFEQACV